MIKRWGIQNEKDSKELIQFLDQPRKPGDIFIYTNQEFRDFGNYSKVSNEP